VGRGTYLGFNPHKEPTMKGTIFDFLKFTTEKPELAKELVELAARHGFEFADTGELGEDDLERVAGGSGDISSLNDEMGLKLQMVTERGAQTIQTLSNILKKISSTQDSIIDNIK
jgi:hypothetical protein